MDFCLYAAVKPRLLLQSKKWNLSAQYYPMMGQLTFFGSLLVWKPCWLAQYRQNTTKTDVQTPHWKPVLNARPSSLPFAHQARVNWLNVSQDVRMRAAQFLPGSCLIPACCECQSPVCFALRKHLQPLKAFIWWWCHRSVPVQSPVTVCVRRGNWTGARVTNSVVTTESSLSPVAWSGTFEETSSSSSGGVFVLNTGDLRCKRDLFAISQHFLYPSLESLSVGGGHETRLLCEKQSSSSWVKVKWYIFSLSRKFIYWSALSPVWHLSHIPQSHV